MASGATQRFSPYLESLLHSDGSHT